MPPYLKPSATGLRPRRKRPTPDFDYEKIIPMPQLGYEPLPPVATQPPATRSASAEPAPALCSVEPR